MQDDVGRGAKRLRDIRLYPGKLLLVVITDVKEIVLNSYMYSEEHRELDRYKITMSFKL